MSTVIHFIGLDVHKESVSVSIAPANSTEVRFYETSVAPSTMSLA